MFAMIGKCSKMQRPRGFWIALIMVTTMAITGLINLIKERTAHGAMLAEGQLAPAFDSQMVVGQEVKPVKLSDFLGKKVVLYFYPKDETPGCTKEACAFRDGYTRFDQAGIVILGCSVDSADSHKAFIDKYNLPFALLLDPDRKIATAYGAANGIPILGLDKRVTYVIDEKGTIIKVYPNVDPAIHAKEIIAALNVPEATATPAPTSEPSPSTSSGSY
jgi:peroxiredoxin Q/BCP